MEAFVSRKKRRLNDQTTITTITGTGGVDSEFPSEGGEDDDDDTDVKLATLASLYPRIAEPEVLLETLIEAGGSVAVAGRVLAGLLEVGSKESDGDSKAHKVDLQGTTMTTTTPPLPPALPPPPLRRSVGIGIGYQSSLSSFATTPKHKPARLLSKKGQTLHLYSPEDIATHTPCTLIRNFLPSATATLLLKELLSEAQTFSRAKFKLFDRTVSSPHTACFFVGDKQQNSFGEYLYNGSLLKDIRPLTPSMRAVQPLVERAVNFSVAERVREHYPAGKKLPFQREPGDWRANAAFVNCYAGGAESVGYHSDQLTYLGPRAIIGSISLGVAREFRVRKVVPPSPPGAQDTSNDGEAPGDEQGQIAIHLPHNSLLVMHAEMQEEWKHSIAPTKTIDPHPVAGLRRINITYRHYREEFSPRYTPRCGGCGVACVLRCVQRQRGTRGRYMWMCDVGARVDVDADAVNKGGGGGTEGKGCGHFEWAVFDDDGVPPWAWKKGDGVVESAADTDADANANAKEGRISEGQSG